MKKLKPVVFVEGQGKFYRDNKLEQNILLKALSEGITDTNELCKLASFKSAADVYRTLDKMAIRKEYHAALGRAGLDLDYLVGKIRDIIETTEKDENKLKALTLLLRSLGLDKYEKQEESGKSWEEAIIGALNDKEKQKAIEGEVTEDYEVTPPTINIDNNEQEEAEQRVGEDLYGK